MPRDVLLSQGVDLGAPGLGRAGLGYLPATRRHRVQMGSGERVQRWSPRRRSRRSRDSSRKGKDSAPPPGLQFSAPRHRHLQLLASVPPLVKVGKNSPDSEAVLRVQRVKLVENVAWW